MSQPERYTPPPQGVDMASLFDPLPPLEQYEIDPGAEGKKVGKKKKGRRYIETAFEIVSKRDGVECRRCHKKEHLTLDHIIPVWLVSQMLGLVRAELYDDYENLEILCRRCNLFKGGRLDFINPKTKPLLQKYLDLT